MKYTWEESDIKAGMFVIKNTCSDVKRNLAFARTVTYKVCFQNNAKESPYGMCSALTDGWVYLIGSKEQVAKHLNEESGHRPLTKEELILMVNDIPQSILL